MGQRILRLLLFVGSLELAAAESLPIAPRRQDDLDQVPKVIFSSTTGVDPTEGSDAFGDLTSQAAPLKTADVLKVGEKVQKLKQTSADGQRKSTKSAERESTGSHRKPATAKGLPKKKPIRK